MYAHSYYSPLRYPGGKGILAKFMKMVLKQNELLDGHYVEVYAGGAGIAWSLLFEEYVRHVHINDISRPINAFWNSVLYDTEHLCKLIIDTPVTLDEWHKQKSILADLGNQNQTTIGFATFFLNRTNRSGIITGGPIGGKAQSGVWKLDARFNKTDLVARIKRIAFYRDRITVYNKDAMDFLSHNLPACSEKTFVYLDPPYYVKGQGLYEDYYLHKHHQEIADVISSDVRHPWIISYDADPMVLSLYSAYRNIRYSINYSAQERYAGSEVMFFSNGLTVPSVSDPVRLTPAVKSENTC